MNLYFSKKKKEKLYIMTFNENNLKERSVKKLEELK